MDTNPRTRQYTRPLLLISLVALLLASTFETAAASPEFPFEGLTANQEAIADWAIGLFAEAGLDLPEVRFVGASDTNACDGRAGVAHRRRGYTQITICTRDDGFATQVLFMHELAHAWDHHSLTEESKAAFQQLRGIEVWRGHEVAWHERGAEQAAEIIVWALLDRPIDTVRITGTSCAELETGYRTLTGQEPLHGFTDYC